MFGGCDGSKDGVVLMVWLVGVRAGVDVVVGVAGGGGVGRFCSVSKWWNHCGVDCSDGRYRWHFGDGSGVNIVLNVVVDGRIGVFCVCMI